MLMEVQLPLGILWEQQELVVWQRYCMKWSAVEKTAALELYPCA